MHIVHTESSCGWGGQEIRILEESRGMISRGHSVQVLCPEESRIFAEGQRWSVPTCALPIGKKNLTGFLALRDWLRLNRVDVLNTHSSTDTWMSALICKILSNPPPIVRTRHISAPIPNNLFSRWLYINAVDHVVTTGEALRQQVVKQTGADPERVTSVPTGIDTERFRPGNKKKFRLQLGLHPEYHYIGIVATLRSWKGHLYLVDAFSKVEFSNWHLLIVGDGPMKEAIENKVRDLELSSRVHLVGQQDNPEDWLRAMDVFCLPSYANEGVPQAILQAMFTGLPVITTPVGAIEEAVTRNVNALLVPPKETCALADAIRECIYTPSTVKRLGLHARESAIGRFSKGKMLNRMTEIFNNIIYVH